MDNVEDKLDGIVKMNETLEKNSLDINILKFLPYRIDSLDNTIGNISDPSKQLNCFSYKPILIFRRKYCQD